MIMSGFASFSKVLAPPEPSPRLLSPVCLSAARLIVGHFHVYSADLQSKLRDFSQAVAPFALAILTANDSSFATASVKADKSLLHSLQPPMSASTSSLLSSHLFPNSIDQSTHLFPLSCYQNDER